MIIWYKANSQGCAAESSNWTQANIPKAGTETEMSEILSKVHLLNNEKPKTNCIQEWTQVVNLDLVRLWRYNEEEHE